MKNRKRILAVLLAGFMSVTTAFSAGTSVVFAAEETEIAATEVSVEEPSDDAVLESSEEASSEESSEAAAEEITVEPAEDKEVVISTIADARAAEAGTTLTVKGVVNYVSGKNVYVEDETGALCLYLKTADKDLAVGNLVTATGAVKDYKGLTELDGAEILEKDTENTTDYGFNTIEAADFAAFVANYNDYECKKVVVKGVTVSSVAAKNVYVAVGDTKALVYGNNLDKTFADFPVGTIVNLTAVVCDYNGIELLPISDENHPMVEKVVSGGGDEPIEDVEVDDSVTLDIAKWSGSDVTAFKGDLVVYADGAVANDGADKNNEVTAFKGGTQVSPIYSFSSNGAPAAVIGSEGMGAGDYYLLTIAAKGYGLYKLSFDMKGSNTGAKNWKVEYSTDAENFTAVGDAVTVSKNWATYTVNVPKEVINADRVFFKVGPADNTSINGKEVASGGTNRFTNILVSGSPVKSSEIVDAVVIDPAEGAVPFGQALTMESATEGASIYFTVNGGEEKLYDPENKPVLAKEDFVAASELDAVKKAVVVAYAKAEGKTDSIKKTFVYSLAKVGTVKASPNGGAVRKTQDITLATATEGATIFFSRDKGETWEEYTAPFKMDTLPATILAKASCEGYEDSAVATFEFTERLNDEYNIYFGQLHSHTSYSDGAGTCEEAFNHAANEVENLDFLAVTDHSNSFDNDTKANIKDGSVSKEWVEGHELADKYTRDDFVSLYGYEMTWSGGAPGHMNTFNTDGFMSRNMAGYESKSRAALQNYYAQLVDTPDSISMFNHPGTTFGDFYDFAYYSKANDRQITLIEVGNGEGAIGSSGYFPSYEYYTRALDKGWHVAPANNQDNHKGRWGDANTGRSVILADSLSRENIYDAIRNMRVYATEDNDLKIYYTLNGYEMGTTLDMMPAEVKIKVKTSDPTDSGKMNVEVIANGGVSVASKYVDEAAAETEFTLSPNNSYYYIRVTQADGNIAVTAPVWLTDVEAVGVSGITADTSLPVVGEALGITSTLFNNETKDFEVTAITYTANGEVIHTTALDENTSVIKSQAEVTDTFNWTCTQAGKQTIEVTLLGYLDGVAKKYTASVDLVYVTEDMVTHVVVDGSHLNDYVTGYYSGNVGNFADIAANDYVKVDVVSTEITKETLADATVLVISAPNKNTKNGEIMHFEDSFIQLVKEYVENGGNLIVCGLADYQDTKDCQSSTEINKLLEAIGATSRINSDEVCDDEKNGGQNYRLYPTNFNRDCYLVEGVSETQKYSAYSGCSILMDETAVQEGKAEAVVTGFESTYTIDSKKFDENYHEVPKGSVVFAAREALSSGSELLVTGTVFLSNFEVKTDLDYGGDEYYANRNILLNYLDQNKKAVEVSTIAQMRAGQPGDIFTIEGYVTAGTAVEGNKFFDTIYVQDDTAGTTVFPIADAGIEIGTKLRITGFVDGYQGDKEIQIYNYKVLNAEKHVYAPKKVTTKEAADYDALGGSLLQVEGKVTRIVTNTSGLDYFYVVDESGVEARVFIDGYILASDGNDTTAEDVQVGNTVKAVGLSYFNPDGACLRVRDRAEIELVKTAEPEVKATLVTKWGITYYVDENGNKLTGLQVIDGDTYFFKEKNGAMVKNDFVTIDGKTYYFGADGKMVKGFMDKWLSTYYFDETGVMATGKTQIEGAYYFFKETGKLVKSGWITEGENKYYAKAGGKLAQSETISKWGKKYSFDENCNLIK